MHDTLQIINCTIAGLMLADSIGMALLNYTPFGKVILDKTNVKVGALKQPLWIKLLRIYCFTILIIYCIQ